MQLFKNIIQTQATKNAFLDGVITALRLKNDAALARALDIAPPVISKIRHGKLAIGVTMLIRVQEETGATLPALKQLLGT